MYQELGRDEKALEDYSRAIRLDPEDAEAYVNRGNILFKLSKFQRSINDYTKAISLNPTYYNAYNNRGVTFNRVGKYAESERDFAKAEELRALAGVEQPERQSIT